MIGQKVWYLRIPKWWGDSHMKFALKKGPGGSSDMLKTRVFIQKEKNQSQTRKRRRKKKKKKLIDRLI